MHYQQVLKALGFKDHQVPMHLALMDAAGDAALIEFTSEGVSGQFSGKGKESRDDHRLARQAMKARRRFGKGVEGEDGTSI